MKTAIANSEVVVADLKASVETMKGPLAAERLKKSLLETQVANYELNVMGFRNAQGSLEDIQKRLKLVRAEKTKLEDKIKKAEQEKNDMYRKFEIAIR